MMIDQKRILVTGGAGFIGSHLCERLLKDGCDVLCVDNFYTDSKRNIVPLLEYPYFEIYSHDITFPLYVEVDEIYNFACPASPIHYQNSQVQTTKVNVHGSINMLGLAKRLKVKILQASTSEVYGDGLQTRSFCYLDDLIDGVVCLMNTPDDIIGPMNLGNPQEFTTLELAEKVIELTNSKTKIRFEPSPEDDPRQRQPDISLARKVLDWEPRIPFEEGLKRTIAYFEELLRSTSG